MADPIYYMLYCISILQVIFPCGKVTYTSDGEGMKKLFSLSNLMSIPTNVTSSVHYKIATSGDALESIDTYVYRSTQHELTISQCVCT